MKSFTNRLAVFAASAVVLGTMAYGQTQMKADVPFAFHTSNADLPAGTYTIERLPGAGMPNTIRIYNASSRRSVLTVSLPVDSSTKAANHTSLVFACAEQQGCALHAVKMSNGTYSYPETHRTARNREAVSMIEIPLTPRNGD